MQKARLSVYCAHPRARGTAWVCMSEGVHEQGGWTGSVFLVWVENIEKPNLSQSTPLKSWISRY